MKRRLDEKRANERDEELEIRKYHALTHIHLSNDDKDKDGSFVCDSYKLEVLFVSQTLNEM